MKHDNKVIERTLQSWSGKMIDKTAIISNAALCEQGRVKNIVSGFFKISVLRDADGALLTNATGGDVNVTCSINSETTATEGKDFVLTNLHDLRIWGDGNRSTVNLNGIVLFDKDKTGAKKLAMEINSVNTPDNSPEILISSEGKVASFTITE